MVVVEFEPTLYTVPETDDVIFRIVKRSTTTEDVTVLFNTFTLPASAEGINWESINFCVVHPSMMIIHDAILRSRGL